MMEPTDYLPNGSFDGFRLSLLPEAVRMRIRVAPEPHPVLGTPCWLWAGRINRNGYGRVCIGGKEPVAHRVTYEHLIGPIPPRMILDHQCKTRACVNPWHTEPVTHRENTIRGNAALFRNPEHYQQSVGADHGG
jgi:hypothetical protein